MIKKLLLFAVFIVVGFTAYTYKDTILASLQSTGVAIQPSIDGLQSRFSQIQTAWTNIPETFRGIILLGIPTVFATFFAWTKTRAMTKLQETQQQASQQISGLNTQIQSVTSERDLKVEKLQAEVEAAKNTTGLQTSLGEAQSLVTQKQQEISDLKLFYGGQIQTFQDEIKRLEDKLAQKVFVK